jgi:acyl CoA:acetate/3-ketoacid CoA transferase alpha subunit
MDEWEYHPMVMDKTISKPIEAARNIPDRVSIAVGGFGLCGHAMGLVGAIVDGRD